MESVSGKLKDKITGRSLPGSVEPFARVQFISIPSGLAYVAETATDAKGDYKFTSAAVGNLPTGDYRVVGYANQYQQIDNTVDLAGVQPREARVAPVLTLLSNPVRITDVKPCDDIPAGGRMFTSHTNLQTAPPSG